MFYSLFLYSSFGTSGNFWSSGHYLSLSNAKEREVEEGVWEVYDETHTIIPRISEKTGFQGVDQRGVWSDVPEMEVPKDVPRKELDKEFLYDSKAFGDLSGRKFKVLRKNIKKFTSRNEDVQWSLFRPSMNRVLPLFKKWVDYFGEENISEADLAYQWIERGILGQYFFLKRKLIGINLYDHGVGYTNFRFCIVDPDIPFCSEYCRVMFYRLADAKNFGIINDGGIMDNDGLYRFKMKLRPIRVRTVYQYLD